MREIEFRGIGVKTGKWIYGSLLVLKSPSGKYAYCEIDANGDVICEVIPETVGQFTGLLDRNGKRIYEGDIMGRLFDDHNESTIVVYKHGVLCAKTISKEEYRPLNTFECLGPVDVYGSRNYDFTVYGNIHDNPELVKGAET